MRIIYMQDVEERVGIMNYQVSWLAVTAKMRKVYLRSEKRYIEYSLFPCFDGRFEVSRDITVIDCSPMPIMTNDKSYWHSSQAAAFYIANDVANLCGWEAPGV